MANAKKNPDASFLPQRIVYWRNPRAQEEGQPKWLHGMVAGEQLDGLRVYVFDTEYLDAMDLVLRRVPWTEQPSGTDRFGLDALFELSILSLSEERQKEVAEGECLCSDTLRPLDQLSDALVRRLAGAKNQVYLRPMAYHIYETAFGGDADARSLRKRRLDRFYHVVLPAFLKKASLMELLELLDDAPDTERGRHLGFTWERIVKSAYWPVISLPQAFRRRYRSLSIKSDVAAAVKRVNQHRMSDKDLLLETYLLFAESGSDELMFTVIDPGGWKRSLWTDLAPHFASADESVVTHMLRDHWGMRYFHKLVGALMKDATATRTDLVTKTLNALNTDRTLPRLRSSTQTRLRGLVPGFVICLDP